jgi:hypothetical protein
METPDFLYVTFKTWNGDLRHSGGIDKWEKVIRCYTADNEGKAQARARANVLQSRASRLGLDCVARVNRCSPSNGETWPAFPGFYNHLKQGA